MAVCYWAVDPLSAVSVHFVYDAFWNNKKATGKNDAQQKQSRPIWENQFEDVTFAQQELVSYIF